MKNENTKTMDAKQKYSVETRNSDGSAKETEEFLARDNDQAEEFSGQYQRDYDADGRYYLYDSAGRQIATGEAAQ